MYDLTCTVHDLRIRVTKFENYGSALRPLYTIGVKLELQVEESPDTVHKLLTGTGLIARETVPFDAVSNFRGSMENKPFYSALVVHDGIAKRYEVAARDTGGMLRTRIIYEPVVTPEELRLHHPADFAQRDITVEEWELHNYKHYFMLFIASKRYESFDIWVGRASEKEGFGLTSIVVILAESELREKNVPASWYLKRLSVFQGLDLEEEVQNRISGA